MFKQTVDFIRDIYKTNDFIPLHEPCFTEREKELVVDCINSTFVSSIGQYVADFEKKIANFCGTKYAVACVNGTSALHIALILAGVKPGDEVITQPLTFIATANAIKYAGATPIFLDIDRDTLGLSPKKLEEFLQNNKTGSKVTACIPMHTFGHPAKIQEIAKICNKYNIKLVEDCAESLGSKFNGIHTGNFGQSGILSFNGNKIITTGGGGMLLTNDEQLAKRAKHLTTQAKIPHRWEFVHDEIGYNYRMPNINAALGLAQMEKLPALLDKKRKLAGIYKDFFKEKFVTEPENCCSNYWLNAILLDDKKQRDEFLNYTNDNEVMTRPAWRLMNKLEMFKDCRCGDLSNAEFIEERLVNIPSGVKV
ncbi:MAG: aminotransferase DegT [Candidatus Melainabacteria bacterium GWF2_37_15]|nr:MAG: aminotransferase DegT [Candidatus Melainabacteria bacterium GWF2_37_15]